MRVLVATDAAGEGVNLQNANLMVNYDLPWNPNRLEQRFGRIHRIGQTEVCHLWNLFASNTREGEGYGRLLEKLKEAREALGGLQYESAHDRGGAVDLAAVVAWAMDESGAALRSDGDGSPHDRGDAAVDPGVGAGAAGSAAGLADGGDGSERGMAAPTMASALTRREREIALLVASGLSNRDIDTRLFISKRTVDAHVEHIFAKLEISSRVKLTMWLQSQAQMGA